MKIILSLILASALFGADKKPDAKDAAIEVYKAQSAKDKAEIAQLNLMVNRYRAILQYYEQLMNGQDYGNATVALGEAIKKACADTGGKLDVPGVTCPPAK